VSSCQVVLSFRPSFILAFTLLSRMLSFLLE
jgi:hypothetical protein